MTQKLSLEQAKERAEKLREVISDYRYHYHVLDESTMSEAAADSLKHELSQLEADYPEIITPDSPTQRVAGQALDKFAKVAHKTPMISLADAFNEDEIKSWISRMKKIIPNLPGDYFCDVKMDGLACSLVYQDGALVQAVTRGDSRIGEDVTNNVRTIDNVPLSLRRSKDVTSFLVGRTEVRGEIVMFKQDFDALNEQRQKMGLPLFKNPRNLAAGTIRQLDPQLVADRPLKFIGYDIIRDNTDLTPTVADGYAVLSKLGITTSRQSRLASSLEEIIGYVDQLGKTRESLPFGADGAVIKLNDRIMFEQLGVVGKTPRAAIAYKFAAEEATTVVKDIVISIGRTGAATPVAVFDPVPVAGTTVQHASLHNADEIARLDVRRGDTVIIYKAGDIIPQVQSVILELRPPDSRPIDFQQELARQYPELDFYRPEGEAVYRAKGLTGPIILKRSLKHFASKGALDIMTLGEKNVEALVDAGLVGDLADIYTLTKQQLMGLERFAELSAQKLVDAIADKKRPSLERFLFGLGIRHVGTQTAIDLADRFSNIEALSQATIDDLRRVEGVGEVVAESVVAWFADEDNLNLLDKFANLGVKPHHEKRTGSLSGKKFVITGSLRAMGRDEAAEKIRSLGGVFQTAVARDTDYLVAGGKIGASKKSKAEQYGTEIITEQALLDMLES